MKAPEQIPSYAPDGTSLGFRVLAAAKRLIAGGFETPCYGRKGHLKAIWLRREDGSNPVDARARSGTRYSFLEHIHKQFRLGQNQQVGATMIKRNQRAP